MNLGISQSPFNVASYLFREFNMIPDTYMFYEDGKLYKNFDSYLFFDESETTYNQMKAELELHSIPYAGGPRLSKTQQGIHLQQLGINTPRFASVLRGQADDSRRDEYFSLIQDWGGDDLEVIVKADMGARGVGQALLTKGELVEFFMRAYDDGEEFYDKYEDKMGGKETTSSHEKKFLRDAIRSHDFFVSERINHHSEFRAVYLASRPDDPLIVLREVGENWQSNTSITHYGEQVKFKDLKIPNLNKKALIKDMKAIAKKFNYPWLSMDVYVTDEGHGFFEFQMQFGYGKMNKTELPKAIIESVKTTLP